MLNKPNQSLIWVFVLNTVKVLLRLMVLIWDETLDKMQYGSVKDKVGWVKRSATQQ